MTEHSLRLRNRFPIPSAKIRQKGYSKFRARLRGEPNSSPRKLPILKRADARRVPRKLPNRFHAETPTLCRAAL